MKTEIIPVVVLNTFAALRSKSCSYSYSSPNDLAENSKQKGIQHAPHFQKYIHGLLISESTSSTTYPIQSKMHQITVEEQNKIPLNPLDDKRVYLNSIKSLPWDTHKQQGDCPSIYCLKFVMLYQEELPENRTSKEIYL